MKTAIWIVLAIICLCCQTLTEEEKITLGESLDKHRFMQLQLFPIRANDAFLARHKGPGYLTLHEAVSQEKVAITEHVGAEIPDTITQDRIHQPVNQQVVGDGAQVNKLFIENTSGDTVLILGGEVVEGGNQDRTIAQDVILPPHSGKIDLSVFCVEHGRWTKETDSFDVAKSSMAPHNVRKMAVKAADQEKVWEQVAVGLAANKADSRTQALTDLKHQKEYVEALEEYTAALSDAFSDDPSVIGVIAIAGGQILGAELFASHELLTKHYPNLLQSWSGAATMNQEQTSIDSAKVSKYFETTVKAQAQQNGFFGSNAVAKRTLHLSVF